MAKDKTKEKEDKQLAVIDSIVKNLQKEFGKESATYLGSNEIVAIPRFTSKCTGLDVAMGGGYPQGKIIEIYGEESTGKSTVCYHAIGSAQKELQGPAALIDVEYGFDPAYAKILGIDVEKMIISQPDDGTEALNILLRMIELGVKVIVVDSVAALIPKEEADAGLEANQMGVHARLMSKALKKVTKACGSKGATVLFTNQTRTKIGIVYGSPETTPGGKALKFYASIRMKLSKVGINKEGEDKVSVKIKAQIVKNKTAVPFKETIFTIRFGQGIDELEALIDSAVEMNIIEKKGSWYSYKGENISQGTTELRKFLETTPEILEKIKVDVKEKGVPDAKISDDEKKQYVEENENESEEKEEGVSVETV